MYWLHHIGKAYWTPAKFRAECKKYGVSRRIALRTLEDMAFGDNVLLAMWDGKKSIIFGQFTVDTVYFQNPETLHLIDKDLVENSVQMFVNRGCGTYMIVSETEVSVPLNAIVEAAKTTGDQLMVGGDFRDVPRVILKKVPHRLGFRPFNWDQAELDIATAKRNAKGEPILYGQYYLDKECARILEALTCGVSKLIRVAEYTKKGQ